MTSAGILIPSTASPAAWTSVWYTMPASSSPASTLVSSDRTSGSLVSTAGVTPALCSTSRPNRPHGTSSAHRPMSRSASAKSSRPSTSPGLPAGTAICRVLVTKISGSAVTSPESTTFCMLFSSAEAYTSAGAPSWIWVASAELAAKLNVIATSGFTSLKASPISVNASVSEAAANTCSEPLSSAAWLAGSAAPWSSASSPQPAARISMIPMTVSRCPMPIGLILREAR